MERGAASDFDSVSEAASGVGGDSGGIVSLAVEDKYGGSDPSDFCFVVVAVSCDDSQFQSGGSGVVGDGCGSSRTGTAVVSDSLHGIDCFLLFFLHGDSFQSVGHRGQFEAIRWFRSGDSSGRADGGVFGLRIDSHHGCREFVFVRCLLASGASSRSGVGSSVLLRWDGDSDCCERDDGYCGADTESSIGAPV